MVLELYGVNKVHLYSSVKVKPLKTNNMEKKLYYQYSDNSDVEKAIMHNLEDCMNWIDADMEDANPDEDREYTIIPVWLTDEEFESLPEAEF
jgi:hypothetical protein